MQSLLLFVAIASDMSVRATGVCCVIPERCWRRAGVRRLEERGRGVDDEIHQCTVFIGFIVTTRYSIYTLCRFITYISPRYNINVIHVTAGVQDIT